MAILRILISLTFCAHLGLAQTKETQPNTGENLPSIEDCIPPFLSNLEEPKPRDFSKGLEIAITAANETAQTHTVQGLNHLHGGWEFEAMRHFHFALKADNECLMAHWGLIMSMLSPSPESDANRNAATERLIELIASEKGTDLERGYAYGLLKYIEEGPKIASQAFEKVAERFPNDIQAEIFAALFGRAGYDELGSITPDQQNAEERLEKVIQENPNNVLPLHTLLLIRAEAPNLSESLPLARQLCQQVPDYPPYFHLLGHYEWRCGNHQEAARAFSRAASLYKDWMTKNEIPPADCPGWIRAECYRTVALASKGDFENALASAEKIANTDLNTNRPAAWGTRQLLWDAKTLPARVLMRWDRPGDSARALASLPKPEEVLPLSKHSLAYWWLDGLRISLEARRLMEAGDIPTARETIEALSFHGEAMSKKQKTAAVIGESSEWNRTFRALEVIAAELRGRLALTGPKEGRGSAFNWFRGAADRQRPTTMMETPPLLTPMAARLGDYYRATNQPEKAIDAYQEALKAFPNDSITLLSLRAVKGAKR